MSLFYSWRGKTSADIPNWKLGKFTYTWLGKSSNKAFWVFDDRSSYRPEKNITKSRVLVCFDFADHGDSVIRLKENAIDFEAEEFAGEAKHPTKVIVKSNEPGAYGIGAMLRPFLTVKSIKLADQKTVNWALGESKSAKLPDKQTW